MKIKIIKEVEVEIGPGANLRDADLSGADLLGADLSGANLIGANLYVANLTGVKITDADQLLKSLGVESKASAP
jgi:uncharacterized protein YjbI with pentapeptide repeats